MTIFPKSPERSKMTCCKGDPEGHKGPLLDRPGRSRVKRLRNDELKKNQIKTGKALAEIDRNRNSQIKVGCENSSVPSGRRPSDAERTPKFKNPRSRVLR